MRICAVSFPELRVELVRQLPAAQASSGPLGVVVAEPPLTEAKLLGNSRLDVVSREARALGITRGQTIAQARARAPSLAVRVLGPDAVRDMLARLAEIGLAFGATVAFGMEGESKSKGKGKSKSRKDGYAGSFGDIVWIDITGCAHLHGTEAVLASRLADVFASLGHACSVAIADGPRVAAVLAREATRGDLESSPIVVVPPGGNAEALEPLPISALPLKDTDVRWLSKIGVRTVGELRSLPREGLVARLEPQELDVLSFTFGDDRAPLTPYIPPEIPEEEATLEYGIAGTDALTFVAKTLCDRLATRLAGRAVATARVELELALDAAMLKASSSEPPPSTPPRFTPREAERDSQPRAPKQEQENLSPIELVVMTLPTPLSTAGDLLAALRPKLDRLVLRAPVLGAKLRAAELVHKREAALSLFDPQPKAERALPRLVAELAADLGPTAVGTLLLGDSWVPEDRSKLVGRDHPSKQEPKRKRRHMLSTVPEPTRLLAEPLPVARESVRIVRHLARTEAIEWWKRVPNAATSRRGVDFVYAWTDDGAAWVEIERPSGAMRIRGWFD